jgi:DNA-3-methyladenine glycosylase
MKRIRKSEFSKLNTIEAAKFLLGKKLCFKPSTNSSVLSGMIIETEAYEESDPASHSYSGKSERNNSMFQEAGTIYVYLIYGIHLCLNIVTSPVGTGNAVLIRALKPLTGIDVMKNNRGKHDISELCSGPAKLTEALGITRAHDGLNIFSQDSPVWIEDYKSISKIKIKSTPRIGISKSKTKLLRFNIIH